jgi:branched-chain amino acid transport system ATP-binding protein
MNMRPSNILELRQVSCRFYGLTAVDNASLVVERETITSLVGPNGAGKTTLFNLISGLLQVSSGDIVFDGRSIVGMPPHKIARRGIGRTFQDPRVFHEMSVLDHIMVGFSLRGDVPLHAVIRDTQTRREYRQAIARAYELLEEIGLRERALDRAQDLSFGEQRFLSIARTLTAEPRLVLLDEPTVGLDDSAIAQLSRMITRIARERGTTVVIVSHNLDVIFALSDRIHLLVSGKVALSGEPAEIRLHPRMIEAYLGVKYASVST